MHNDHMEQRERKKNQQANDDRTSLVSLPSMAHTPIELQLLLVVVQLQPHVTCYEFFPQHNRQTQNNKNIHRFPSY